MSLPSSLFAAETEELLVRCPACGGALLYLEDAAALVCPTSKLRFPITEDDIPVMLVDEADELSEAELAELLEQAAARGLAIPNAPA
ncbi:Trm112 family protein [Haliangium ochraceum]|uniref:Uncharacterized protein n=1 Tax=Haliangium ochraceum (strain DSM 14365 / JCM 11303 / SMP-2) TaxID=502025 RepID=D0LPV5_HALO1|nr:Trm112 family protein [Haliangium ochraceum]ACY16992.1 protein of unknown function DUF343 [Haliangium ochraceum DSM 14365]